MTFLPMIAIFVVFYFLLIRPQQKRAKETKAMLERAAEGRRSDHRRRHRRQDRQARPTSTPSVEIAPNVEISVQRGAISQLLPKGTIKAL